MKKLLSKSGLIKSLALATAIGVGAGNASSQERADTISKDSLFDRVEYRVGGGVGTNRELFLGASAEYAFNSWASVGAYGNYFIQRGNPVNSDENTEVTRRERQLIGPATYKLREDKITIYSEGNVVTEAGLGLTFKAKSFEFPVKVGAALVKEKNWKHGESTISFERNMEPLGQVETISGEKVEESDYESALSFNAGVRYNLPYFRIRRRGGYFVDNLSVGASFNRTSKENSFRAEIAWRF